jgi:hypothetical protein
MGNFCTATQLPGPSPSPSPSSNPNPNPNPNPNTNTNPNPNPSPNPIAQAPDVKGKSVDPERREQKACFGAGCYWGTEKFFRYDYKKHYTSGKWLRGQVGFMGPEDAPSNPTYEDVCTGVTGHVEVSASYEFWLNYLCRIISIILH